MNDFDFSSIEKQMHAYLDAEFKAGRILKDIYDKAKANVIKNLKAWMQDPRIDTLSPNLKKAVMTAIQEKRWADLSELYFDEITFGTGGIRGRAVLHAYDEPNPDDELVRFAKEGLDAQVLKGPNSINNIVLLLKSAGVAKYAKEKKFKKIVLGYDSRLHGKAFTELNTRLFLAYGLKAYLFDEAVPWPEVLFASVDLGAELGVFISASHNDKRYNGYKICLHGSQFDMKTRQDIYENYIKIASTKDILLKELEQATAEDLVFLGGEKPLDKSAYYDSKHERRLIDMHARHREHSSRFILNKKLLGAWAGKVKMGYAAFHGSGRHVVPRLLHDFHFTDVKIVEAMQDLNGWFPLFKVMQQPDPGDETTMAVAIHEFEKEHGKEAYQDLDVFVGTDPDADRTGLVVKTGTAHPCFENKSHVLLTADEAWTLLLWYRLKNGLTSLDTSFIGYTHVTTDALGLLAKKHGVGYFKTWVGITYLANTVLKVWRGEDISPENNRDMIFSTYDMTSRRKKNILICEQSNGFSILGAPPKKLYGFGEEGHVMDKDGTMATLLLAELSAYAKSVGKTLVELLHEEVYADPDIGLFYNLCEPSPKFGQYEGLEGMSKKITGLKKTMALFEKVNRGESFSIGPVPVRRAEVYRTGKYDLLHNWTGFPDEGIRFFFKDDYNWMTIRPSGTSQSFRFHVQLHTTDADKSNILDTRGKLIKSARRLIKEMRDLIDVQE
ncbi:MAG: hypothetical protein ABIJ21_05210 [Nanoarchaeota archaeon]